MHLLKRHDKGGNMNIIHYSDPGHGWLKVPKALLGKFRIADEISGYSYQRKEMAYLEEDCDAKILLNALESRGIKWVIKNLHTNRASKIRNYKRY